MAMEPVVVDVWGGPDSCDHVARFYRSLDDAIEIARRELAAGFLVNLRCEAAWGPEGEFDDRQTN